MVDGIRMRHVTIRKICNDLFIVYSMAKDRLLILVVVKRSTNSLAL